MMPTSSGRANATGTELDKPRQDPRGRMMPTSSGRANVTGTKLVGEGGPRAGWGRSYRAAPPTRGQSHRRKTLCWGNNAHLATAVRPAGGAPSPTHGPRWRRRPARLTGEGQSQWSVTAPSPVSLGRDSTRRPTRLPSRTSALTGAPSQLSELPPLAPAWGPV